MFPHLFVAQYHYLKVNAPTGPKTINAWKYYIKDGGSDEHTRRKGEIGKIKDAKALKGMSKKDMPRAVYARVWDGKGSPDDIAAVLENGVATGLIPDTKTDIQKFTDLNVGTDCGGFVRSFFRTFNTVGPWGDDPGGGHGCRKDPKDIRLYDTLHWYTAKDGPLRPMPRPGHIALVGGAPYGGGLGKVLVTESRGKDNSPSIGVAMCMYEIKEVLKASDGDTVFKADCLLLGFTVQHLSRNNYVKAVPTT